MRNQLLFAFLLVVLLSTSMLAQGPCVLSQLDRTSFFSWEKVSVFSVSGDENCSFYSGTWENWSASLNLVLVRLDPPAQEGGQPAMTQVEEQVRVSFVPGQANRQLVATFDAQKLGLKSGRYAVLVANVSDYGASWNFQQLLHFTIGSDTLALAMPYIQPAAVVVDGYLYFRGQLGNENFADGYLYQPRSDRTEILRVQFRSVDPEDNIFVNQPHVRGGSLDLSWVRAKLPNNSLDPKMPVYGSFTINGGAITATAVVYDPANPSRTYLGGFGGGQEGVAVVLP